MLLFERVTAVSKCESEHERQSGDLKQLLFDELVGAELGPGCLHLSFDLSQVVAQFFLLMLELGLKPFYILAGGIHDAFTLLCNFENWHVQSFSKCRAGLGLDNLNLGHFNFAYIWAREARPEERSPNLSLEPGG